MDPKGDPFDYAYDAEGRLSEIRRTPAGAGASELTAAYAYTPAGLRREVRLAGGLVQRFRHDVKGRLAAVETLRHDVKGRLASVGRLRKVARSVRTDPPILNALEIVRLAPGRAFSTAGTGYVFFHGRGAGRPGSLSLAPGQRIAKDVRKALLGR